MSDFDLANRVLDELARQMPFLRKAAEPGIPPLRDRLAELEKIAERLAVLNGTNDWARSSVKGYVTLSMEFLTLQRQLEMTGRYLLSTEREAVERVYTNPGVFTRYYLPGLLLTEALWPNHYRINRFFLDKFVQRLHASDHLLEVGVGTGYHLRKIYDRLPQMHYTGVDISDLAIDFAQRYAFEGRRTPDGLTFRLGNATENIPLEDVSTDAAVCGEVLEHVERPDRLLAEIRRVLRPGKRLFLTTVVFAANIDHIFLFESADAIRKLLERAGWLLEDELVLPTYEKDSPEAIRRPMNYAAILRKMTN